MKNLKKVLALAVAFVMCFTMFAGALVFTDVVPGGDYSEAITILSDLGVIAGRPDGNFGINDTITRADACCLIARLMTGKTNPPKSDHVQRFSDVPSGAYYEDAVNYCVAYGVTVGTGGGKFSPELNITDGQFIAMLTRAMGYDTAENPLSFPMGNISVAQQMGLLENVDVNYQSDALRGEDAQMLYNALFARYDREARNKNIYQAADDHYEITIAESVFNMGRLSYDSSTRRATSTNEVDFRGSNIRQPVQCEAHTWVIAGVDARQKENTYVAFAIDDDTEKAVDPEIKGNEWAYVTFTYDNDIEPLLGYRVELWGDMSHDAIDKSYSGNRMDVMAIKTIEGQSAYGYHAGMYDGDNNNKITTAVDGKTLIISRDGNVVNLANIMLKSNNWETVAPDAYAYKLAQVYESTGTCTDTRINLNFQDGDQYTLYDWDNDDDIDFARRETFKYAEVETLSSKRAVLSAADAKSGNWGEYALALDNDNLKVQADGIEEGDVVEISVVSREYVKGDGEVVTIKLTPVDPESQTLEKINLTKDTYTFNGEELSMADRDLFDVVEEDESYEDMRSKENVGQAFNIWFDRSGYIIKTTVADDRARGYLMVLDTYDGTSNLNYNNRRGLAAIDVLFDDNTVGEEVEVVKDLKIDSYSDGRTGYDKSDRTWDQLKVVGNVFKYYMNEDNRITRLEAMTTYQSADYSFDDSKDRIGILDNNGNLDATNNYTNYSFTDDAVVFAARQAVTNKDVEHAIGYIRVIPAEDHGATDLADHGGDRYYVDPDDVIAVKVEDIPEIDNRPNVDATTVVNNNGEYQWTENDVTHPYELLPTLKQDTTTGRYTYRTKKTDLDVDSNIVLPTGTSTAATTDAYAFRSESNAPAIGKTTYGYSYTFGNRTGAKTDWGKYSWIDISGMSAKDNQSTELHLIQKDSAGNPLKLTTPRIAYEYSSKTGNNDIQVALLGVDTLDYFNQSSVKLALITDVNYYGKDSYSIDAAIDGKVGEFKTIADDESDIFTGNTIDSYEAMRTYLNQEQRPDEFRGLYNGLYAEVTMNSDGLITKIRAMDYYDDPLATTVWGADNTARIGSFAEGTVYRVIRGVTTQLRTGSKNTLVTFQPNPIAYSATQLYQLNKSDDHNLYDNLESYFDSDTYFYKIDQRPRAYKDQEVAIHLGFVDPLDGDLKEATSDVLEVSEFIDTNNDALYFMADFAVRKSDTDQLVAVFAFDDEFKNNNTDKTAVLAAKYVSGSYKGRIDATDAVGQITEIAVDSSDARLGGNVQFTYTLRDVVNKVDVDIHYPASEGDTESAIAGALGSAIRTQFKDSNGVSYVERYIAKDSVLTIWWKPEAKAVITPNDSENGVDFTTKVTRAYVAGTNLSDKDVQDPTITLRLDDYYAYVTAGKDVKLNIVLNGIKVNSADATATEIVIPYTLTNSDNYYTPSQVVAGIEAAIRAEFTRLGSDAKLEFTTSGGALAFSGFSVADGPDYIDDENDEYDDGTGTRVKVIKVTDVAVP